MRWEKFAICLATLGFIEGTASAEPPSPAPPSTAKESAPPPAEKAPASPPNTSSTAKLHVDSPKSVVVEHRTAADAPWVVLCASPCDVPAPVADEYRVIGEEATPSAPFKVDDGGSGVATVRVDPGDRKKLRTGSVLLAGGLTLLVGGAIVTGLGLASNPFENNDGETHNGHVSLLAAGAGLILAGLGTGIYGGALVLDNRASHIGGSGARPILPPPATGSRAQFAPPHPSFVFPIISARF